MDKQHFHRIFERQGVPKNKILLETRPNCRKAVERINLKGPPEQHYDCMFVGSFTSKRAIEEAVSAAKKAKAGDLSKAILILGPPDNEELRLARFSTRKEYPKFYDVNVNKLMNRFGKVGEKTVKALFNTAKLYQPSVICIDELASILGTGANSDLKKIFLTYFEKMIESDDKIILIGITDRPYELDEEVLRCFPKRIFDDLPDDAQREAIVKDIFTYNPVDSAEYEHNFKYLAARTSYFTRGELMDVCEKLCKVHYERAVKILKTTGVHTRLVLTDEFIDDLLDKAKKTMDCEKMKMYEDFVSGKKKNAFLE